MTTLQNMSHNKLATHIERCNSRVSATADAVFAAWPDNVTPFQTVTAGLGETHPAVVAYRKADDAREAAYHEARRRCGPVTWNSLYPNTLRAMGRRVRRGAGPTTAR